LKEPGRRGGAPEPVWRPSPGRETSVLFDVFILGQRMRALVGAAMADAALRPDEYAVYSVVFESGSITLTEMAQRLAMPITTIADYVRTMLARGHARKAPHPTDRRAALLTLTPAGLRAHRRASEAFDRAYRSLIRELDGDEDQFRHVIQAMATSAERALASMKQGHAGRAG
jgi:DNA-binding MarR family transcriptional regulator